MKLEDYRNSLIERYNKYFESVAKNETPEEKFSSINWDMTDFISLINMSLLLPKSDPSKETLFFGNIIRQLLIKISFDLAAPAAVSYHDSNLLLLINPVYFLSFEKLEDFQFILLHEAWHIINQHLNRQKEIFDANEKIFNDLGKEVSSLICNFGLDIAANQFIDWKLEGSITVEYMNQTYGLKLPTGQNAEFYIESVYQLFKNNQQFQNDIKKMAGKSSYMSESDNGEGEAQQGNPQDKITGNNKFDGSQINPSHDIWNKDDNELNKDINKEMLNEKIKEVLNTADDESNKQRGKHSAYIGEILKKLNEPPIIPWQKILAQYIGSIPVPYKTTNLRLNRRQPNRVDLDGRLPKREVEIVVALDTSGSMGKFELEYCMNEIFNICKSKNNTKITIIECDASIKRIYEVKKPSDVIFNVTGRGGTCFSPVFEYIKEKRKKDIVLVYLTDGYGEYELTIKPYHNKTLWILTNGDYLSLKEPHGSIKSLKLDEKYKKAKRN